MKNLSVKRIVIYSISLLASIMLFVGLSFKALYVNAGLGNAVNGVLGELGLKVTGFNMLSFGFPTLLREGILNFLVESDVKLFEILLGVFSYITLLFSVFAFCFIIVSFFKGDEQKDKKRLTTLLVVCVVIALIYSAISITSSTYTQYREAIMIVKYPYEDYEYVDFTTKAYLTLIFQAICLIAYIVCAKCIKAGKVILFEKRQENGAIAKSAKSQKTAKEIIESVISGEKLLLNLLQEYKTFYDNSLLSTADYMDKKVKLMKLVQVKANQELDGFTNYASLNDVVFAETEMLNILKEYKDLLGKGIISDADYTEKKVALLYSIVK